MLNVILEDKDINCLRRYANNNTENINDILTKIIAQIDIIDFDKNQIAINKKKKLKKLEKFKDWKGAMHTWFNGDLVILFKQKNI